MTILHIASITDNYCSGVCIAVPQYIIAQQEKEDVAFINLTNMEVEGIKNQLRYTEKFDVRELPYPYCNPDIIVFHEVYRPQFLRIFRNIQKNDIPYIIVPHGCLTQKAQHKKKFKKVIGNILFFMKFINNSKALQCLSEYELNTTNFGNSKFISVNGVVLPDKKKTKFNISCVNVVYIGRLDIYHKGIDLMLDAFELCREKVRAENIKLKVYGPNQCGQAEIIRKEIKKRNLEDIIELKEAVVGQEKRCILLDADLFIQTSRFEGMPMGVLEALSYGVPCILTRGTAVGEIVSAAGAGWLAENDSVSVADAICNAISQKKVWKDISNRAIELIKNDFETNVVADKTISYYKRIISKS